MTATESAAPRRARDPCPARARRRARAVRVGARERSARQAGFVLETCHRVEAYVVIDRRRGRGRSAAGFPAGGRLLVGEAAVRHAIAVAVGRDSVVVGEDQILHQLRESRRRRRAATAASTRSSSGSSPSRSGPDGGRARGARAGAARSPTSRSTSIERRAGPLARPRDPGRRRRPDGPRSPPARRSRRAPSVSIANRIAERAERARRRRSAAESRPLRSGRRDRPTSPASSSRCGGPWPIGQSDGRRARRERGRRRRPVGSRRRPGRRSPARSGPAPRLRRRPRSRRGRTRRTPATADWRRLDDARSTRRRAEFCAWLEARDGRAAAEALAERADRERAGRARRSCGGGCRDLEPEARDAIEGMSRHLAARLLREPLERLGRDPDGRDERAVRDLFAL